MKGFIKRKTIKRIAAVLVFVAIGFAGFPYAKQQYNNIRFVQTYEAPKILPTPEEVKTPDIQKRMEEVRTRADHKKKVTNFDLNEARRVATEEYEKDETAKYAKVQEEIKKSKDQVKKGELSLQ